MESTLHGSLGLQASGAAADVCYALWRSARGAVVLHGMTGYEASVAGWCAEAYRWRCEERLDIGDRRPLECGRGRSGICVRRTLQRRASQPLGTYDPPFAAPSDLSLLPNTLAKYYSPSLSHSCPFALGALQWPMSIWILFITISLLPLQVGLLRGVLQRAIAVLSPASNAHNNSMASAPNIIRSARLEDFSLASFLAIDSLGPFREPALEYGPMESHACGNFRYCGIDGRLMTTFRPLKCA
jgi:hypothetical protein